MNNHMSGVHCGSVFEPGSSALPYYCTPPVCVSTVLDAPGVWWFETRSDDREMICAATAKQECCEKGSGYSLPHLESGK